MPRLRGKRLVGIEVNGNEFSIRATDHALMQMEERRVSVADVGETISSIGVSRLLELQELGNEVCVLSKELGVSVVFGWYKNRIMVITVLREIEQVFAKNGTLLECVQS